MDGLSVLLELKNQDPGLPVVMITSEEEHIMDDAPAPGSVIPPQTVSPSQIFTTLQTPPRLPSNSGAHG